MDTKGKVIYINEPSEEENRAIAQVVLGMSIEDYVQKMRENKDGEFDDVIHRKEA